MGKGGDSGKQSQSETKREVLIDGRYYDVSKLKHPGGTVIDFYAGKGIDASQAFANFHLRSRKAKKLMDSLPSRAADKKEEKKKQLPGQAALLADFEKLTQELEIEGFFKPAPGHVAYRLIELIVLYSLGFYLLKQGQFVAGIIVAGIAQGRCGWLMHEGGHNSLTGNIKLDHAIQVFVYGVGCGMSGSWWRSQHNKHHAMPQKLGHDVDLNTLPLVAFTEKIAKRIGIAQKYWIRLQAVLFPLITTLLVALGWQYYLHVRHIIRRKNRYEGLCLILRHLLWHKLITVQYGLWQSTLLFLAYDWFAANYIFLNFAVSHTHLDTVPKEDTQVDWVRYAALHTMNVSAGPFGWVDWWMSYLNYQIEHHLFPSMPQFRMPVVSRRVKALFEKHGFKYDQRSYFTAMADTFKNLHNVGMDVFYG